MGDIITYSLKQKNSTSDVYYRKVEIFTDEVICKILKSTETLIKDFQAYIVKNECEILRSESEYAFELLVLGVLWKTYINKALGLGKMEKALLVKITALRQKSEYTKVVVDYIRGILGALFLLKEESKTNQIEKSAKNISILIGWLAASGEFTQEVKRLQQWLKFISNRSENEVNKIVSIALDLEEWFEIRSEEKLGCFTEGVKEFLGKTYLKHKWQEDNVYCGRKRVEYHLNMVGAEIMNRAFRKDFLNTKEKRLLLPGCMRFRPAKNCKAVLTEDGYLCTNCSLECRVSQLTQMGIKYDFSVFIIPHESSAFTKREIEKDKIGIIGVACVLQLIAGGWKAKDLGFVPQCVLLDYCGCKKHWHKKGIITNINISQLMNTLEITETLPL